MVDKKSEEGKVFMAPGWQDQWQDQLHGVTYMDNFTILLLLRAIRLGKKLGISCRIKEAGAFRDMVLQVEENETKHHQLIHCQWETTPKRKNITTYALTSTEKNAPFGLIGYFNSFRKMKTEFTGSDNEVSDLVICTNGNIIWPVTKSLFGISWSMKDSFITKRDGILFTKYQNLLGSPLLWLRNDSNNRKLWARFLKENVKMKDDDLEQDIKIFLEKIRLTQCLSEVKIIKEKISQELTMLGIRTLDLCDAYSCLLEKVLEWRRSGKKYFLNTVHGSHVIEEFKKSKELIEFGIEEPVKHFSGRSAELEQIIAECKSCNRLQMLITGVGGMGKTELAKKFAAECKSAFHCILWMKGESLEGLMDSFKELAFQKLSIAEKSKDGKEKDFTKLLQEINKCLNGKRCLLILDNVFPNGQESEKNFLKKFLSLLTFEPFLLMTSCHKPWDRVSFLTLKELKEEEAVEMVKESLRDNKLHIIRSFTKHLKYYPLALKLGIAFANENPGSVPSYLETFNRIFNNLCSQKNIEDEYMITTIAALEVIMEKLRDVKDDLSEICLQIISFMHPDDLDEYRVVCCFEEEAKERVLLGLRTLNNYGIIQYIDKNVNINTLLQSVVRCKMPKEDEIEVLEKILKAKLSMRLKHEMFLWDYVCRNEELVRKYSHIPVLILKNLKEGENFEEGYEFGRKNVKLLSKYLHETDKDLLDAMKQLADVTYHYGEECEALELYRNVYIKLQKSQGDESTETMSIRKQIALLLFEIEKYDESLSIFQEMLKCLENSHHKSDHKVLRTKCFVALILAKLGKNEESAGTLNDIYTNLKVIPEDIESLNIKRQLANVFLDLGVYKESWSIYREIYAGFKRLLGVKHLDTLKAQCSIAMILGKLGEKNESLEMYQTVKASMKEVLGDEHPETLGTAQCVASLLNELGRSEESLNISEVLYKTSLRVLDEEDPITLKFGQAIALSLRKLGKLEESLGKYKEIYSAMKQVLNEDDPLVVSTGNEIASLLFEMRRFEESHCFYNRIYPVLKKSLGEMHLDVIYCGLYFAVTFIELGKYKEGHELCNDVYKCCERTLGIDHPDTLKSGCRVALILEKLGRSKESLVMLEKQLDRIKKVFGDDHPETLNVQCSIASALSALGKFEQSFKIYEEVCKRKKNHFGADHPETLSIECRMAACLTEMGKDNESLCMNTELLPRMQEVLGEKHTDVINVKCNIAFTLRESGKYELSLEMYKDVYNQVKILLGEEDSITLGIRSEIALTEGKSRKCVKSLSTHMKIYGIMKKLFGEDHPSTIKVHGNIASTLLSLGKTTGALDILQEIKERLRKALGEEHPETLKVSSKIAHALGKMKKYEESRKVFDEVCGLMRKVLGDEHKTTMETRKEMSCILRNCGRYEESLAHSLEIHQIMIKIFGKEHQETLNSLNDVAATLSKLEKFDECLNAYHEVYNGMKAIFGEENLKTIQAKKNMDQILQKIK